MMSIKPIELQALREQLKEDECLIQYIPTSQKLYIQVAAKNMTDIWEVAIPRDSLMRLAKFAYAGITHQLDMETLEPKLKKLHQLLIYPVRQVLRQYKQVTVIPIQQLCYLPMGALIDEKGDFEITNSAIGYISSAYLMGLIYQIKPVSGNKLLLIGDPDGSLPGARKEVESIRQQSPGAKSFIGKQATLQNIMANAQGVNSLHLATHGVLDEDSPDLSYLLLEGGNLTLPEIFTLPLKEADLVFLSACETNKGGKNGLEYATITRAFVNAGTPSVVSTLWKVNDGSSKDIAINFYKKFSERGEKLTSLVVAQRTFLQNNQQTNLSHPFYWAGFVLSGKP
jgi:CHAT domain-containing protein